MFLKSLVVRGFKSFADKTTLEFEPGITVVVGPNGSGKSNIVDAISWVLGEQGPRSLRGGKMEDVIYAGSRLRPALGMAEVSLTIDNTARLLPIDFTEVTISRLLFRSGDSEYRLNGAPCRLLDIQEVLSDTGVGREQHTIIGQGQLDDVLSADPIQMRGFIEEAAGIGKHRRRKDRALRKIAATEQNLVRLSDLLSEIRRQLRPLREQAEVARKHAAIADEFERIRIVMAARELAGLRSGLGSAGGEDFDSVIRLKESELAEVEQRLTEAEAARSRAFSSSEGTREASWALTRVIERLLSLKRLAEERARTLEAELAMTTEAAAQAKVAELDRRLAELSEQLTSAISADDRANQQVEIFNTQRSIAQAELSSTDEALGPKRAMLRELMAEVIRIRGEIAAITASRQAAEQEVQRLQQRDGGLREALQAAKQKLDRVQGEESEFEASSRPIEEKLEELESELVSLQDERDSTLQELRGLEQEAARWGARAEMRSGSSPAAAARIDGLGIAGVVGKLSDLLEVPESLKRALESAFGRPDSVLVVEDDSAARLVLSELQADESVVLLIPRVLQSRGSGRTLADELQPQDPRVRAILSGVYVVGSLEGLTGTEVSGAIHVTRDGAFRSGPVLVRSGADAAKQAEGLDAEVASTATKLTHQEDSLRKSADERSRLLAKLNDLDASMAGAAERLAGQEREIHALEREIEATDESSSRTAANLLALDQKIESLHSKLPELEAEASRLEREVEGLQEAHVRASAHNESAVRAFGEARLEAGMASERKRLLQEQSRKTQDELVLAKNSVGGVAVRRSKLESATERVGAIAQTCMSIAEIARGWSDEAESAYQRSRNDLLESDQAITDLRTERTARAGALDDLRGRAREEDLSRSEMKIRSRVLEERMSQEWKVDPAQTVDLYGHIWEVEDESRLQQPIEKLAAMDDEALRRKHVRFERELDSIGRVNPLAAQEFDALTEREEFLASQIADVRSSRRDLFKVVSSVDEMIRDLFGAAYQDVSHEYERLFAMLFPGGQGRLRLTEPNDLLQTGVEVEARPGGKNLKRLSLLSGGERALSALAFLFAIFRARPSPFYILDEVEAALDDVNLHRFLGLIKEFRDSSQLLVVTHQKRTMEAADVLYGVSIKSDGASRVISQRLSETSPASDELRGRIPTDS